MSPQTWMSLTKYYIGFLDNGVAELMEDLAEYHAMAWTLGSSQ